MTTASSFSPEAPRRLYRQADIVAVDGGFAVRLDDRVPRTPAGRSLVAPTARLAGLVADEWRSQGERIDWKSMPATRLAYAALDAGPAEIDRLVDEFTSFAAMDLLCYRAEGPRQLVQRQEAAWTPPLRRVEALWAVTFARGVGIAPLRQPSATVAAAATYARGLDRFTLLPLAAAARLFGSAILAVDLARGMASGEEAFAAAQLDESFQQEAWGADPEAAARRQAMLAEARMLESFFAALRSG